MNFYPTKVYLVVESSDIAFENKLNHKIREIEEKRGIIQDIKFTTDYAIDAQTQDQEYWFNALIIYTEPEIK